MWTVLNFRIYAVYVSGVVGLQKVCTPAGLVNFLIAPLFGALHITTVLGVNIAPGLNKVIMPS